MGKPSKAALSKAGGALASNSSSKSAKSKAGLTLGKADDPPPGDAPHRFGWGGHRQLTPW